MSELNKNSVLNRFFLAPYAVNHVSLPHGVQQRAFLGDSQQLVWHGHVVGHRLLAVVEKSIGSPDLAGHQVVEAQHGHGPFEF